MNDRRFAVKTALQMHEALVATTRKLGPYVLLEVLLPGGTLFAMTLFAYRNPQVARRYVAKARQAFRRAVSVTRNALRRRAARVPSLTSGLEAAMRALG
jgi:ABC-type nitrate/sulfonate/bicarbonate transport system substrate-binding protein